jgi:hypothetical protein
MQRLEAIQAREVYDILVAYAGAAEGVGRDSFELEFTSDQPTNEWRFCGDLGFGGKFRFPHMTVDCYPEDETPSRLDAIERTNARLAELRARWAAPPLAAQCPPDAT